MKACVGRVFLCLQGNHNCKKILKRSSGRAIRCEGAKAKAKNLKTFGTCVMCLKEKCRKSGLLKFDF